MFSIPLPDFLRRKPRPVIVPAIRLSGVIGSAGLGGRGLSLAGLEGALDAAFARKRAPAVALLINSPGGSPVQSALIAGRIRALAAEKGLPVLAFVEDVAASGGYWLACAADEIFADPSSIVGSIGVVTAGFGFQEAIARLGIERRVHTTGARKALLDPFRPERRGRSRPAARHPGRHPGAFHRAGTQPAWRAAQGWGCRAVRWSRLDRRRGPEAGADRRPWRGQGHDPRPLRREREAGAGQPGARLAAAPVAFAGGACTYAGGDARGARGTRPLAAVRPVAAVRKRRCSR